MDLAAVLRESCLPESRLPAAVAAQLPRATPPPPWSCRVRAVVWVQRAPSPLPSSSPYAGAVRGAAVGAVVEYLASPVGPYREVLVGQLLRGTLLPVLHVPFLAVDSLPSVHGGRAHWSLPKTVARFTGDVGAGEAAACGDDWSLSVRARPVGPRLPVGGPLRTEQDGRRALASLRGRGRLARVEVRADGLALGPWLHGAGRGGGTEAAAGTAHPGLVAEGRMTVHPPV